MKEVHGNMYRILKEGKSDHPRINNDEERVGKKKKKWS